MGRATVWHADRTLIIGGEHAAFTVVMTCFPKPEDAAFPRPQPCGPCIHTGAPQPRLR